MGGESELTFRAIFAGCVLGALLAAANVYTGLKTAYVDGGSITASVLAYAAFAAFGRGRRPYGAFENNLTQTIAASAAVMSVVAGVAGPIPALALIGQTCPPWALVGWGLSLGVLGIAVAVALRSRLIVSERLAFPSGAACGEVIAAMASAHGSAERRARALLWAALIAAVVTYLRDGPRPILPQTLLVPGTLWGVSAATLSIGASVSPLMFSTGMLAGLRTGTSMLLGSLFAWVVLSPALVHAGLVRGAAYEQLVNWLMWPGAALVLSSSFTALLVNFRPLARGMGALMRARMGAGARPMLLLAASSSVIVIAIAWQVFALAPLSTALALALALVFAGVCARSAGETDVAPVGTLGGVTQLLFGASSRVASLASGSIVAGAASQTAATLWAFKAGARLGAAPRVQVIGQLLGALVGALVVVPVYAVVVRVYGIGTDKMPAPGVLSWKATAEAVQAGAAGMPPYAPSAAIIALGVGCLLTLLAETRLARFLPSPVALGIAFLLPPSVSVTTFLGGLAYAVWSRRAPSSCEEYVSSLAGGGIAGESLLAVALAALIAAGLVAG